jgi:hypothetical protein
MPNRVGAALPENDGGIAVLPARRSGQAGNVPCFDLSTTLFEAECGKVTALVKDDRLGVEVFTSHLR